MTMQNEASAAPEAADSRTAELEARVAELERRLETFESTAAGSAPGEDTGLGVLSGASGVAASTARAAGRGAQEAVSSLTRGMLPDDARQHLRAAMREQLLAARIYLDRWIERLEQGEEEPQPRRHETIEIEE